MSGQGISSADFTALETAKTADITSYIFAPDTPPETIDTGVLPANLQTKVQECNGNDNCKLVSYDFITDIGEKASSSPYLIQLDSTSGTADNSDVAVLAKIGDKPVTSLGIPTENLTSQYKSDHLQLTPPVVSGPIGYSTLDSGYAISGTGTQVSGTSADACATECTTRDCQGFNFDESSSSCSLFSLVDTEAAVGTSVGGGSNTITEIALNLKLPITGLAIGQKIEGLDEYINGDVEIKNVTSSTQVQIKFLEQIVKSIPANTPLKIKAPTTISTLQSYMSDKERINFIGVNGNETYGYSAIFKILAIPGLPTRTNGQIPAATTPIPELVVPVDMTGINAVLSTGNLPIDKVGGPACNTGVYSTNQVQTTACSCSVTSIADPLCKIPMNVKSYTQTNITFQLPDNSTLPLGSVSGSPLNLSAIEFTVNLDPTSPAPSDRIVGWTGTIGSIPVTVKSFTASTITFSFPAQTYSAISAQNVTLSDTKGRSCQDIKACNASIQRLLDTPGIGSFSTKDLVACSGCNERAYKKPLTGPFGSKLREYLWFENAGAYACTTSAPPGTTLNDKCEPVCATTSNGDTAVYDSASQTCRVTCRAGFYWNGTTCVSCPSITLPTNITIQASPMCQAMCVHASGTTPANMLFSSTSGTDIPAIPNYTKACVVSCSQGLPNPSNTRCCSTTPAGLPAGTTITSFTNDDCSTYTVSCSQGTLANSTSTRCCPVVTPPAGTRITGYTDDCVTPTCDRSDGTNDFIDTTTGASGPTCNYTCQSVTRNNGTSSSLLTGENPTNIVLPAQDSTFTTLITPLTGTSYSGTPGTATKVQTNIGSYYFFPQGSHVAIYTGSGAPTTYYTLSTPATTSVAFPFKIKINSIQFWKTGATSVNINLKNNYRGTDVLNQTFTLDASPITFSTLNSGYGKYLTLAFTGTGTVAYKITATVQKICTAICSPPSGTPNGRAVLDTTPDDSTRTCVMICDQGFNAGAEGCSTCIAPNLDPGTSSIFNVTDCGGVCNVFDPIASNRANTLAGATASSDFPATGTRVCQISACPSGRTMYTVSGGTTLNNSGCCPVPSIPEGSGVTWSYPSGSASTSTSTGTCTLTCSPPNPNTYDMSVTTEDTSTTTRACTSSCPAVLTEPVYGFTVSRDAKCTPICTLTTSDSQSYTSFTYTSTTKTVVCTKNCNAGYAKGSALSKCCLIPTLGTNTKAEHGTSTSSCNSNPCAIVTTSSYTNPTYNSSTNTCSSVCTTRETDDTGAVGTMTADYCVFSCAKQSDVTDANATVAPATKNSKPYCAFGCSGSRYVRGKSCCDNVTLATGTGVDYSSTDCTFTCKLDNKDSTVYTASSSGRRCVLGCKDGYYMRGGTCCANVSTPEGTRVDYDTTGCGFTCGLAPGYLELGAHTSTNAADGSRACVLGCKTGFYQRGTLCCSDLPTDGTGMTSTKSSTDCSYTCAISDTTTYPTSRYQAVTPATGYPTACEMQCKPVTSERGITSFINYNDCTFTCGINGAPTWPQLDPYLYEGKPNSDGSRSCVKSTRPTCTAGSMLYPGAANICCRAGQYPYDGYCKDVYYKTSINGPCTTSGYQKDTTNLTGFFISDTCFLTDYLNWIRDYRNKFSCPPNDVPMNLSCRKYNQFLRRYITTTHPNQLSLTSKFMGFCIAQTSLCTDSQLVCTSSAMKWVMPTFTTGACVSL